MQGQKKNYEAEVLQTIFYEPEKIKVIATRGIGGKVRIDVRYWYLDKKTNEYKPTKRGVNMEKEVITSIIDIFETYYDDFMNDTMKLPESKRPKREKKKKEEKKEEEKVEELKLNES